MTKHPEPCAPHQIEPCAPSLFCAPRTFRPDIGKNRSAALSYQFLSNAWPFHLIGATQRCHVHLSLLKVPTCGLQNFEIRKRPCLRETSMHKFADLLIVRAVSYSCGPKPAHVKLSVH